MTTTTGNPTLTAFRAERAERARCQEAINTLFAEQGPGATKLAIRLRAATDHAQFPQYEGYWDGSEWTLARITIDLRSKGGDQAVAGDVVLFRYHYGFDPEFYSVRLGWMCAASYGYSRLERRS